MPDGALPPFLHPFARPAAPASGFLTISGGQGACVFDAAGRSYIDALASLWYCQVGHGEQRIVDAVTTQLGKLAVYHTFDRFTNAPADALASRLAELAPMTDARVFLTDSGSEAVETAVKLARLAHHQSGNPERTVVVGRRSGYHGMSYGALSTSGISPNEVGFGPLVGDVVHVAHDGLEELEDFLIHRGDQLAAIIAEPVMGAGGVIPPTPGYLAALRECCDAYGAYLIFDEVICGFGRLGSWWAAERYGVRPDLVTFAKGVTSGYAPLGGVLVGPAVRAPLEADDGFFLRHGHTYSGHPTACAAALANLDVIEADDLAARAPAIGARLSAGLRSLVDGDRVRLIRGEGAVWAAVLADGVVASDVRDAMLDGGVITRSLGNDVVAFCPPLVISEEEIDRCVEAFGVALATAAR